MTKIKCRKLGVRSREMRFKMSVCTVRRSSTRHFVGTFNLDPHYIALPAPPPQHHTNLSIAVCMPVYVVCENTSTLFAKSHFRFGVSAFSFVEPIEKLCTTSSPHPRRPHIPVSASICYYVYHLIASHRILSFK